MCVRSVTVTVWIQAQFDEEKGLAVNDDIKRLPGGDPSGGTDAAREFQQALADPELAQNLRLRLEISGGVPSERYDLSFEISGDDTARIRMLDEIKGRHHEAREVKLPPDTIRHLLNQLDVNRMVSFAQSNVPIPPCSLVGRLEVSFGDHTFSMVFMADEEQARTAGYRIPQEFERVIHEIYDLGAKHMGIDRIRP